MNDLLKLLGDHVFRWSSETELHRGIARVFDQTNIAYAREVILSGRDRIDFLVGAIGIEVKIAGARRAVLRQLARYAEHDQIAGLILVTTRHQLRALPERLNGKPIAALYAGRGF